MRRSLGKFSHRAIGHTSRKSLPLSPSSSFDFSTSAGNGSGDGGGGGRGRGRGSDFPKFSFTDSIPGKSEPTGTEDETSLRSPLGHGRGKPLPSPPNTPPLSSFGASGANGGAVAGRGRGTVPSPQFEENSRQRTFNGGAVAGRGRGTVPSPQFEENSRQRTFVPPFQSPRFEENSRQRTFVPPPPQSEENSRPRTPIFFRKDGEVFLPPKAPSQDQSENQEKSNLPASILRVISGAGRGKPTEATTHVANEKVEQVNRHIKPRPPSVKMSQEEAINKARGVLSRGGGGGTEDAGSETQGGFRGVGTRGGRGRGQRGGWSGRGRGRGGGRGMPYRDDDDDEEDEEETAADKANYEKLEKLLGPEKMDLLVQAFEEAGGNVLPSPEEEAYVDAMDTNLLLECEPEYLMEFDSNPDIDEKPPIPLRDALEKMKPFLMAYENIRTDKEWQDVIEETMKNVPLMKELVDEYSGPNKSTAKQQGEELERVAKTLPASAPASVKRFTDRAVLSLQSNPGWGFHRKCQFMDKLVGEVSQSYK